LDRVAALARVVLSRQSGASLRSLASLRSRSSIYDAAWVAWRASLRSLAIRFRRHRIDPTWSETRLS